MQLPKKYAKTFEYIRVSSKKMLSKIRVDEKTKK